MSNCDYNTNFSLRQLNHCCRYIDDITVFNDNGMFDRCFVDIYPKSQVLKKINTSSLKADVLDMTIEIDNSKFSCTLFDKRDKFDFHVTNFPHANSFISRRVINGVINSQILRYITLCTDFTCFLHSSKLLFSKLIERGYSKRFLYNSFDTQIFKHRYSLLKYNVNYSAQSRYNILRNISSV